MFDPDDKAKNAPVAGLSGLNDPNLGRPGYCQSCPKFGKTSGNAYTVKVYRRLGYAVRYCKNCGVGENLSTTEYNALKPQQKPPLDKSV